MNKKIKVIELFDIIAKGIDISTKVEYCGKIYKFDSEEMDYIGLGDGSCLSLKVMSFDNLGEALNSEVEILEDEEEIDIEDIKNEYNEHAKNIINDLIKDGYELEGIKESIEAMINYIESIKEKIAIKSKKKLKKRKIYQKFFKKVQKIKK